MKVDEQVVVDALEQEMPVQVEEKEVVEEVVEGVDRVEGRLDAIEAMCGPCGD